MTTGEGAEAPKREEETRTGTALVRSMSFAGKESEKRRRVHGRRCPNARGRQARHKLDGTRYAIKKVSLACLSAEDAEKVCSFL